MTLRCWITNEFLENALQEFFKTQITVLSFSGNIVIGDSYASDIFRTTVKYNKSQNETSEEISMFIKRAPQTEGTLLLINQLNLFDKEIEMYRRTLPEYHKILGDRGPLSPACIFVKYQPFPLIVLEDISVVGFKMENRRNGLDLEHCLFVVRKLAELHSASLILQKKIPEFYQKYTECLFCDKVLVIQWIKVSVESLIDACKSSLGFQKYAHKLKRIKDEIPSRCSAAGKFQADKFWVLNHGDCWINNFLFQYNDFGVLKEMRFVDFQIVACGSPAIDLHYFLATSPTIEVYRDHLFTILDYYYDQLVSLLEEREFTPTKFPTREEFKKDWLSRAYYGFAAALTILPIIKSDDRDDATLENAIAPDKGYEGSFRHHMFNNSRFWNHFQYPLKFFDNLGIFDS